MTVENRTKSTPLLHVHEAAGARMVDFAGWRMPVQYAGLIEEHNAVRMQAGLFDVSHMGELRVDGAGALDLLQYVTCNDVARLRPGRAQYTALTTPEGCFVDDLLVYQLGTADYLLVVNAANTEKDKEWLTSHAERFGAAMRDESADWGQIAIQGPRAEGIVASLTTSPLDGLRPYRFLRTEVGGVSCILSRTGYTGEDGFELYVAAAGAETLWKALSAAGAASGVVPVGLGARDTLRLEAKLTLYGNDIDDTTTVLEADLGWIVKMKKGDFVGRSALARQIESGVQRRLTGFEMEGRAIPRHGYRVLRRGIEVGRVTSGSYAPFLRRRIGLAYLPVDLAEPGTELSVEVRDREEAARVVATPFYKRSR